jgi:hypothetical protein
VLDEREVKGITPFLTPPAAVAGKPHRLKVNEGKSFQGSIVLGMGFIMSPEEAQALIAKDARNRDVLFPYLNGEDLNSQPDQSPSRWVINFFDWPLNRDAAPEDYVGPVAADYPDCLAIVDTKVKPERERNRYSKTARELWWLYERWRPELYATIKGMKRVLVTAEVSKHINVAFRPVSEVFSHMLIVFPLVGDEDFGLLQSSIHEVWAREKGSTLETRFRYTPSDCFDTLPFPAEWKGLPGHGQAYDDQRRQIMLARQEGLTKTYNRFHDRGESSEDIVRLRQLHVQMDEAVAAAYGWTDLDLGHGFHETRQGVRYTISEAARQEVLGRLLTLNHQRHEEEVKQGLHEQKRPKGKPRKRPTGESGGLFG